MAHFFQCVHVRVPVLNRVETWEAGMFKSQAHPRPPRGPRRPDRVRGPVARQEEGRHISLRCPPPLPLRLALSDLALFAPLQCCSLLTSPATRRVPATPVGRLALTEDACRCCFLQMHAGVPRARLTGSRSAAASELADADCPRRPAVGHAVGRTSPAVICG